MAISHDAEVPHRSTNILAGMSESSDGRFAAVIAPAPGPWSPERAPRVFPGESCHRTYNPHEKRRPQVRAHRAVDGRRGAQPAWGLTAPPTPGCRVHCVGDPSRQRVPAPPWLRASSRPWPGRRGALVLGRGYATVGLPRYATAPATRDSTDNATQLTQPLTQDTPPHREHIAHT